MPLIRRGSVRARLRVRFSRVSAERKPVEVSREDLDTAGVDGLKRLFAMEDMERGAAFAARFCKYESARGEVKGGEGLPAGSLACGGRQWRRPAS